MSPLDPKHVCNRFVIIGAGQAGAQAAITLRDQGFDGSVVLLGQEVHPPYMRPPLSKKFLTGEVEQDRLHLRPPNFYSEHEIDLRCNTTAVSIDRSAGCVHLGNGQRVPYDRLLLATGSRPRRLLLPDGAHPDVLYLRGLDDAVHLRDRIRSSRSLVVVGGGYIGLEVAATAVAAGLQVSVLERSTRLLERVTTPIVSAFVEQIHVANGVQVRCNALVTGMVFEGNRIRAVRVGDVELPADLVLVGIGSVPNVELAMAAGLPCADGIVVDASGRTADPDVFAAGDCTRHPNALYGRTLRLESVQNAVDQASVAAINMADGQAEYTRVPWFWSNQYELKIQSAGLPDGHDEVIECGDRSAHRFALKYLREGQLIGVDAINMPAEYLAGRRSIAERVEAAGPAAASLRPPPSSSETAHSPPTS